MHSQRQSIIPCLLALLIIATTVSGCISGRTLRSDYDRSADFGSYETYNFIEEDVRGDGEGYQSLFSKYMIAAIVIEMEKRGYRRSDNPDLLVHFNSVLQEKTKVTTSTSPTMGGAGYYGYRSSRYGRYGGYGAWGGYGYATETNVSQYTEGTFNIDLIDRKRNQLVWEAVGEGRISQKDKANLEQRITEGVPRFFTMYPFRAGDSVPVQDKVNT